MDQLLSVAAAMLVVLEGLQTEIALEIALCSPNVHPHLHTFSITLL